MTLEESRFQVHLPTATNFSDRIFVDPPAEVAPQLHNSLASALGGQTPGGELGE